MSTDDVKRWVMSEIVKSRYDMPYVRADDHDAAMAKLRSSTRVVPRDAELLALNGKFRETITARDREIEQLKTIKSFVMSSASSSQDDAEVVLLSQHKAAMKIQSQDLKSRWENQVHEMDGLIAARDRRIEELEGELTSRSETARQTREDWLEAREHIQTLKTINESLNGNLAEARKEIERLRAREPAWRKVYGDMTATIANTRNKVDELEEELATARAVNAKLREQRNQAHYSGQMSPSTADKYIVEDDSVLAAIAKGGAK